MTSKVLQTAALILITPFMTAALFITMTASMIWHTAQAIVKVWR